MHHKERKKTDMTALQVAMLQEQDNPREGWEDGTPPPHRDFKERSVVLAVAHPNPWSNGRSASFCNFLSPFAVPRARRFSLQPSCHLAVVPLSSFSPFVASSSVASLSSASSCVLRSRRRLPIPCSRGFSPFGATLPSSRHMPYPEGGCRGCRV